jgi:hypothetical protein
MVISITSSHPSGEQREPADRFLAGLLPHVEREAGLPATPRSFPLRYPPHA